MEGQTREEGEPANASILDDLEMDENLRRHAAALRGDKKATDETGTQLPGQSTQPEKTLSSE